MVSHIPGEHHTARLSEQLSDVSILISSTGMNLVAQWQIFLAHGTWLTQTLIYLRCQIDQTALYS